MIRITILCLLFGTINACSRQPSVGHTRAQRTPGDNGFRILISGEPTKYIPGTVYTLSLLGSRTHNNFQQFIRFTLGVEPKDNSEDNSPQRVGSFQLFGDSLTTFNEQCVNTISEANDLPKSEIQVMWTAPASGSGCVIIRAMVLQDRYRWYANDDQLSRELCEQTYEDTLKEGGIDCCACDEAKYKLIFEGIWSNITHPKDFPFSLWLTHFSDVIGASHEQNYSFWGEGHIATDGFRQLAEWGSVRGVEVELRSSAKHLKSIIKAAGLWHPRVNTNTTTNFKVDRRRHLVSVASMFGPSPDWVVGVNGLNLCLKNCTWVENMIINLYPWDAGTDSGITYMSPNAETNPRERMYRITTKYPEDPRAPFYDPNKDEMEPLAKLYLIREKITQKNCDDAFLAAQVELDENENTEDVARAECRVTDYSEWSECSVSCGKGLRMRTRQYLMPQKAQMFNCDRQLVSKEMCVASVPECGGQTSNDSDEEVLESNDAICETGPWSEWSECSVSCGKGLKMRTRRFKNHMGLKKCLTNIVEKEPCMEAAECTNIIEDTDPECPATVWSDWSPCSASCGRGVKLRTRLLLVSAEKQAYCSSRLELVQQRPCQLRPDCTFDMAAAKEVCLQESEVGPCRGYYNRWYFEPSKLMCVPFIYGGCRGNQNNFLTAEECNNACQVIRNSLTNFNGLDESGSNLPVDCVVTDWSPWSECSASCGLGRSESYRMIKIDARNGGKRCPKKLNKRKRCNGTLCDA